MKSLSKGELVENLSLIKSKLRYHRHRRQNPSESSEKSESWCPTCSRTTKSETDEQVLNSNFSRELIVQYASPNVIPLGIRETDNINRDYIKQLPCTSFYEYNTFDF